METDLQLPHVVARFMVSADNYSQNWHDLFTRVIPVYISISTKRRKKTKLGVGHALVETAKLAILVRDSEAEEVRVVADGLKR
jgi:hypothetical protein